VTLPQGSFAENEFTIVDHRTSIRSRMNAASSIARSTKNPSAAAFACHRFVQRINNEELELDKGTSGVQGIAAAEIRGRAQSRAGSLLERGMDRLLRQVQGELHCRKIMRRTNRPRKRLSTRSTNRLTTTGTLRKHMSCWLNWRCTARSRITTKN
jgi:hypothetical protein